MNVPFGVIVNKQHAQEWLECYGWEAVKAPHITGKGKEIQMVKYKDPLTQNIEMPHDAMQLQMSRQIEQRRAIKSGS
jgi:hypothetical protein